MKKVLIVSFYFSENEIIGSHRSQGLARYLHEYGWHPIIITKKTEMPMNGSQYDLVEVPYHSNIALWKRRLGWEVNKSIKEQKGMPTLKQKNTPLDVALATIEDLVFYPDDAASWIGEATKIANNIIESENIDAIVSSSSPVSSHFLAHKIKKKYGVPWLADFRDLWSQNHYHSSKMKDILNIIWEKMTISDADILTTVSEPLSNKLRKFHSSKKVVSILNGFNPEEINPGTDLDKKFRVIHTGSLYRGRRDPEPLFRSLSELINEGRIEKEDISVDFYGPIESWLSEDVTKYCLQNVVNIYGPISRSAALIEQRRAQILLLLTWDNPDEYGVYTGKLFEYIAAKRPIFLLGAANGVASTLLNDIGAGKSASTVDEIKQILLDYYSDYSALGEVRYFGSPSKIQSLSQKRMAYEFSTALNEITKI
jgi:glycosyltransferase involved in cell wall biosynthesis